MPPDRILLAYPHEQQQQAYSGAITRDLFDQAMQALPNSYLQPPRIPIMNSRTAEEYRKFREREEERIQEKRQRTQPKTRKIRLPRFKEK